MPQAVFAIIAMVLFLHEPATAKLIAGAVIDIAIAAIAESGSTDLPTVHHAWERFTPETHPGFGEAGSPSDSIRRLAQLKKAAP